MPRFRLALPLAWLPALFLAAWFAQGAHAQAVLDANTSRIDLWPHVRVLADPSRALALEQALAARERFTVPGGAYATLGMAKEAVWLRVPIAISQGGEGPWVLDLDYALLNRVDVYSVRDGQAVRHVTLGDSQPFAARPLQGRTHAVPLEFTSGGSAELLMRVETAGAKILPLSLSRLPSFHARALGEQLLQGALGCLGLVLLLYSLAQWLSLREHLYLKYALLVLCSVMFSLHFFGIGEVYFWTDREWPARHMAGVTSLMAAAATALFVEDALAGDLNRWLRRGLRAVAALHVVATVAHALDLIDIQTVAVLMSTTGLAPALMGVPGALAKARRGDSVGIWFIGAWLGYFIASAILVGVVRGRVDANFWTLHSFQIGATLDMLIFMHIALLRTATRMRERRRLRQSFSGYVGPVVMEEILSGRLSPETGGEQRYVCVMFSDIRGHTARSEAMKPTELLAFLNRYFDGVVSIVHEHGGTVVCFLGDGIMVVFGAPQRLDNPCDAGFRAAQAMLANLGAVNARLRSEGLAPIDIGIGLHAGEAVIGHIGARQRHEYAAIGDVTNVAARLESSTKDTGYRLVISQEVASRLDSRAGLVPLGSLSLKGHTPVEAHGFDVVTAPATAAVEGA
jgi:class 3 adenylate cyclase